MSAKKPFPVNNLDERSERNEHNVFIIYQVQLCSFYNVYHHYRAFCLLSAVAPLLLDFHLICRNTLDLFAALERCGRRVWLPSVATIRMHLSSTTIECNVATKYTI